MLDNYNLYIFLPFAFLFGISTGSFVSMASYRLPRSQEIVFKPSYCPNCSTPLRVADLVPLFSWLFQKGQCRYCHTRISVRYPLVELSMGFVFMAIVYFNGVNSNTVLLALLATELAILIVTDLEHFIIPDSIQIAMLATGMAYQFHNDSEADAVLSSIAFGLTLGLALHYGYIFFRKKDGLGFGDVKFFCVAGSWIPLLDFVPFLFLSGLMGIITGILWRLSGRGPIFPFGPAIAVSLFVNVLVPGILSRVMM